MDGEKKLRINTEPAELARQAGNLARVLYSLPFISDPNLIVVKVRLRILWLFTLLGEAQGPNEYPERLKSTTAYFVTLALKKPDSLRLRVSTQSMLSYSPTLAVLITLSRIVRTVIRTPPSASPEKD